MLSTEWKISSRKQENEFGNSAHVIVPGELIFKRLVFVGNNSSFISHRRVNKVYKNFLCLLFGNMMTKKKTESLGV